MSLASVKRVNVYSETQFEVKEGEDWAATDELLAPLADIVEYLSKSPWPGTLTLTATFRYEK